MGYFPMCISLKGKHILLAGEGNIAKEKLNILLSFDADIYIFSNLGFSDPESVSEDNLKIHIIRRTLTEQDLELHPAFVVVADVADSEKERISALCHQKNIPVNVVDVPTLCSFYFPAIIQKGDLTVSVSTGGKSPGAASYLRHQLEPHIPDRTDEILEWLSNLRKELPANLSPAKRRLILKQAVTAAFERNRPLETYELQGFDNL
jgi:siroheme synthase-like protein